MVGSSGFKKQNQNRNRENRGNRDCSVGTELNPKVEEGQVEDRNFTVDEYIKRLLPRLTCEATPATPPELLPSCRWGFMQASGPHYRRTE